MNIDLNIKENEKLVYFYHNWQAGKKNCIHDASCHISNYGTGMHQDVNRGENGVWIGPFSKLDLCIDYVENTLKIPTPPQCTFCFKKPKK